MEKFIWIMAAIAIHTFWGCSLSTRPQTLGNEFAIYLPAQRMSPRQMSEIDIGNLKLEDTAIISVDDIISYTKETHEIELTASARERIKQVEVPVWGTGFVVCLGQNPIYWGVFWTPASSIPFNGVVILIWKPFGPDKHVIQIQLGYPSSEYFGGEDPRSNQEILQSLGRAGKLKLK